MSYLRDEEGGKGEYNGYKHPKNIVLLSFNPVIIRAIRQEGTL